MPYKGDVVTVLIVIAVIGLVVKRFAGEPLSARELFLPPLILVGIGAYQMWNLPAVTVTDVVWVVLTSMVGVLAGMARGATIRLFERDGMLHQRYTPWTVLIWVVGLGAGFGLGFLALNFGMHAEAKPMILSIGVSLLGEMLIIGPRALKSGIPFAPDRRSGARGISPLAPEQRFRSR
ncbi:DUF1453 family protein [Pseudonocardiaceae bacterium YIM PH 21723]|nr:DUF1453 family protein [Pseudonocardiaceae bacterium YIM PH 21723]